ncbi:hypothetical protein BH09VER1_BH09VER1_26570 [soil metagenome]
MTEAEAAYHAEFATLGYYEPGFIHLRVNTHDDLSDLFQLTALAAPPAWVSTFLHEYVHFLQDLTTTHGLLNFVLAVEHLKNANEFVLKQASADFSIPVKLSNKHNWLTNQKLRLIYRGKVVPGRDCVSSIDYLDYSRTIEYVLDGGGETIEVPKYQIGYFDNGAQTRMSCHFGSIHLKEYMAHAVQNQFAPDTVHDDMPYRVVELIVEKEVPKLAGDSSLIVALCEACLMHYHPAEIFFDAIERMKRNGDQIPRDPHSAYSFVTNGLKFKGRGTNRTFESLYESMADQAVAAFRSCLKAEIFKSNVQWFVEVMSEARKLRLGSRGFFTQLVDSKGKFSSTFTNVVDVLGIPFTSNVVFKGYFFPPKKLKMLSIQPYYPKVFQAISLTYSGACGCSLLDFCNSNPGSKITNTDCEKQPWMRVTLPDLCPYAQLWRTWGLEGKIPGSAPKT